MNGPDWLRGEWSYRAYILGLRWALGCFAGFALTAVLGVNRIIGGTTTLTLAIICSVVGAASVLTGIIGWLLVPDKILVMAAGGDFLRMALHDIFLGMPSGQRE